VNKYDKATTRWCDLSAKVTSQSVFCSEHSCLGGACLASRIRLTVCHLVAWQLAIDRLGDLGLIDLGLVDVGHFVMMILILVDDVEIGQ
jgi:hypothetical protein